MTDPGSKAIGSGARRKLVIDEEMRRWERDASKRACGALAAALRNAIREPEDSRCDLLSVLSAWVEDAAERDWLRINEYGYAVASVPSRRWVDDVPPDAPDRWQQIAARREQDQARVMSNRAALHERVADNAEEKALNQALEIPAVQHAALRALGVEMVEPGLLETKAAGDIVHDLAMVMNAGVRGVPEAMLNRVQPLVAWLRDRHEATWEAGLILAVRGAMFERGLDARGRVEHVLRSLAFFATEGVPRNFREPTDEQITRATEFMRTLRYGDLKKEFWPPAARVGAGKPLSARGAAAGFAECFSELMEPKASRAGRRKK